MLTTDPVAPSLQSSDDRRELKSRCGLLPRLTLISLFAVMVVAGLSSRAARSSFAANSTADIALSAQNKELPSYLEYVAWPNSFEIPFSAYFVGKKYGPWFGNLLQYQYAETNGQSNAQFKSSFTHCPELPGVPLRFFGRPCAFYLFRDPTQQNTYTSYVYSQKEYFRLASNFGPPARDMIARYHEVLPLPPTSGPPATGVPITHPRPATVAVQWFPTSGSGTPSPSPNSEAGYYAAIAEPTVGPDGQKYKPPFSFGGAPPAFHMQLVQGQLVYDWRLFKISPQFKAGTFTPPSNHKEVPGVCWPVGQLNCPTCHLSDTASQQEFFIEPKRSTSPCPSPTPR